MYEYVRLPLERLIDHFRCTSAVFLYCVPDNCFALRDTSRDESLNPVATFACLTLRNPRRTFR